MKKNQNNISGNIWKYFWFNLSQRRHFMPILSIFFLSLPNTNAQQIGLYVGLGFLASFLFEIPSGYFSDRYGHKNTLVLSKILMITSMTLFITASSLLFFILGSIFLSLSQAFSSGTDKAFMHDTLLQLKKEDDFTKIMSKIGANVSLLSLFFIILLPFTTSISITFPLKINLIFDVLGLFACILLVNPKREKEIEKKDSKSIFKIIKEGVNPGFFALSLFTGAAGGFLIATNGYRQVYLVALGLPIIYLGFILGLSRLVWFFVGHYAHTLEKNVGIKNLLKIEILLFPLFLILAAIFSNPYIVGIIIILPMGYYWGRIQITEGYTLKHLIKKREYKATILSVKNQVSLIIRALTAFLIGYVMIISYKIGYVTMGIVLFFILLVSYLLLNKHLK